MPGKEKKRIAILHEMIPWEERPVVRQTGLPDTPKQTHNPKTPDTPNQKTKNPKKKKKNQNEKNKRNKKKKKKQTTHTTRGATEDPFGSSGGAMGPPR